MFTLKWAHYYFFYLIFQKEEKQLEATIDALIHRVQDIKNSIAAFLIKLENEYQTLNW